MTKQEAVERAVVAVERVWRDLGSFPDGIRCLLRGFVSEMYLRQELLRGCRDD